MNKTLSHPLRIISILLVIALAWTLRARAVNRLPIDYDEDDYLRAGQQFAHLMRNSDWRGFMDTNYRAEHPPLAKIAYGLAILPLPEQPLIEDVPITANPAKSLPRDLLHAARTEAAVFGTLTAFLLALVDPLGGLMLAIHSFTIKYTSQVMLDGLSALLSLSTVLAYIRYKKSRRTPWLIGSAILLGLAADSKFLHGTIGFAILVDWMMTDWSLINDPSRRWKVLRTIFGWGILSLIVFFAANPFLWPDPIGRLQETLEAVRSTTTNPNVTDAGLPAWEQLVWLSSSVPWAWFQNDAFLIFADTFIAILAVFGFKRMWKKESVFGVWLLLELFVLLVWRTKWPQYILIVTAPLALSAGEGLRDIWQYLLDWLQARKVRVKPTYTRPEMRRAVPWLVPGLIAFVVLTLFPMFFQVGVSMTDFSGASLRNGLQGGLWPAMFGASPSRTPDTSLDVPYTQNQVNFIGPINYFLALGYVTGPSYFSSGTLVFNILWTVLSVSLQTAMGLGIALLLWQGGVRLGKFWQMFFILPWAIPEMIGAAMWFNVFQWDWGWVDLAIRKYGADFPFAFLSAWAHSTNGSWIFMYLLAALWYGFPFMMLAASAGLKLVPKDVYDAAAMDGADAWQTFRHVTWPLLLPLLAPAIIIRGIFAFNQFYLFQAFFDLEATLATTSYNIFNTGGIGHPLAGQFSLSAAVNIIAVICLMGFIVLFNRWSRAGEGVTYA